MAFSRGHGPGGRGTDAAGNCGKPLFPDMIGRKVKSSLKPRMVSLGLMVVIFSSSGKL
jgi:hypothetical protein